MRDRRRPLPLGAVSAAVRAVAAAVVLCLVVASCTGSDRDAAGDAPTTSTSPSATTTSTEPPTTTTTVQLPPAVPIRWSGCGGGLECATVDVPVSYQDPTGPTLQLALVKNPADLPDRRIGTLLVNPGGPGASGVRRVARGFEITPEVADRFDIVGFDPRGIGQSSPIRCGSAVPAFRAADLDPDSPGEEQQLEAAARAVAEECAGTEGARLGHYGSVDVVHDIEVIRRALGEDRISFVGISYGTLLGQLWAEWYPTSVRAMVLDGVVSTTASTPDRSHGDDPRRDQPGRGDRRAAADEASADGDGDGDGEAQARAVDRTFDAMTAACAADASCPLADDGGLGVAYDELARRIETGTVAGHGVGPTQLAYAVFWATYDAARWPRLWEAVERGLGGDLAPVADLAESFTRIVPYAPFAITSCLDRPHPSTYEGWRAEAAAKEARSPRFGAILGNELLPCAFWPPATLGPVPVDARGAPPILVVGSTGDAATPYEVAVRVARRLESGALLTVEQEGHVATGDSDCADDAITRYLVDLAVPAAGTRC
ncbi:MAG: alpha/beta hydrolase [Acidimicrobiales bacterium]